MTEKTFVSIRVHSWLKWFFTPSVYLIFLIWDVIEVIVIYFVVVETKGLTLEEINEVFEREHPKQYSEQLQRDIREARRRHGGI